MEYIGLTIRGGSMIHLSKTQVLGLLGLTFLVSCTQVANKEKGLALISDSQNIVSTRGSDEDQFFALIKLKSPALLEKSKRLNGVTVVDQKQKSLIEAEQTKAIANLKKLDPTVQVVYRYKMVLNGLAVVGPRSIFDHLPKVGLVTKWEKVGNFERNVIQANEINGSITSHLNARNSSKFLGAEKLNQLGITGKGIKVGVLDTGIDYTHAMFGGAGTVEAFKSVNPSITNSSFPTPKVAGGIDLVGTSYSAGAHDFAQTIPKPDLNPIDEAEHGTHVAGTIAGIGDNNVTSYNGMAPEASLYAIKVFGANGSTSDMVVIAGLEFAADPNGDGVLDDQLDVVNLSLGSGYGTPKMLYAEAIKNLVNGGTSAVISAGNSGDVDYIVGAPGSTTEALSVASSYDDTEHNWIFTSSKIKLGTDIMYVEALEAETTKPIVEAPVVGEFYYIGLADKDLNAEQVTALTGKVALIDRGGVNFNDKIKRAAAGGAIGVVVANNAPGPAIMMSTVDIFTIPAIMITQDEGSKIKAALQAALAPVGIEFLGDKNIERPEVIDTISSFSSKGPRSVDGFLKPEITAPGSNIISSESGSGNKTMQMSGTSMAAPHMTGVMALLKQGIKNRGLDLTALELKYIAMGNAKTIADATGKIYPVTRQGAGRVQASEKMINTPVVADVPSLAFGEVNVASVKNFSKTVRFKNISGTGLALSFVFEGHPGIKLATVPDLNLEASTTKAVGFFFKMDSQVAKKDIEEFDGLIKVMLNGQEVYRLPVLAVVHKTSDISVTSTKTPALGSPNLTVNLQNRTANKGEALFFNALAVDPRKKTPIDGKNIFNTDCDLQSAGYRIISQKNEDGSESQILQFAVKTYKPMTTWTYCDVSILFDGDNDGKFDQELVGTDLGSIPGITAAQDASILIDAKLAQQIRKDFEAQLKAAHGDAEALKEIKEDYTTAIQDVQPINFYRDSTLVILQADVSLLVKDAKDNLNFKILTTYYSGSSSEFDDYLSKGSSVEGSYVISANPVNHPYYGFQENAENPVIEALSLKSLLFTKGSGQGSLIGYYPQNELSLSDSIIDRQQQVIKK